LKVSDAGESEVAEPVMAPVDGFRVRPEGSDPLATE
jgi:hypothetical protein